MIDSIEARKALFEAVDELFDEQVEFLKTLVGYDSLRGNESALQKFVAEKMTSLDYEVDMWRVDLEQIRNHPGFSPVMYTSYDNAWNVVGSLKRQKEQGRSLILNGHVDVVPSGPEEMWSSPPFEATLRDGWLFGRGAADMKAGLSANLYAVEALKKAGFIPAATLYQQSVVEEESTGNGALAAIVRGYRADGVVVTEPSGELIRGGQVGVIWVEIEIQTNPGHAGQKSAASNTVIESSFALMKALRDLESAWNAQKPDSFKDVDSPIKVVISKIAGGDWASSTPAKCRFEARIGIFPEQEVKDAQREIESAIDAAAQRDPLLLENPPIIRYHGFLARGYVLPTDTEIERTLSAAHVLVNGVAPERIMSTALNDSRFFVLYQNTPTMVYGPLARKMHGIDEAVELESVRRVTKVLANFIANWCGLETK